MGKINNEEFAIKHSEFARGYAFAKASCSHTSTHAGVPYRIIVNNIKYKIQ